MRFSIILLATLLVFGCSSKSPQESDAEVIVKVGTIAAKEDVDMDQVETGTGSTRTSVYGSISGGSSGSRISIGLGFLLEPVRYEVDLVDGGQMTIYHDSKDFEVGDCVKITVHPDEKKYPPTMKRNKGGC
ncbi:MAG: hypothetical protein GWP56_09245 [Gammaproteobacteria bacterium]|nr:hypothetical protein [Gammaproteobacteria bacterium]